jgi:S1-C subfamily serine protease
MNIQSILFTLIFTFMIEISGCASQPSPSWDSPLVPAQTAAVSRSTAEAGCTEPIPDLFVRVSPAVVSISAVEVGRFEGENSIRVVVGSGFIIGDDGLLLTNSHVVFDRQAITVIMDDGRRIKATLLGADPIYDLAVLRIPVVRKEIPQALLGNSDMVRIGEDVLAIGNPLALEQTLTRGVVSGLNRFVPDSPFSLALPLIQTDAPINPGNSGGPLFNRCGEAIGINTLMVSDAQNIGFAIPINIAKQFIPEIAKHGRIIRPWFGMSVKPINKEAMEIINVQLVDGLLVEKVDSGSPADLSGIRVGNLPVTIAGEQFLLGGDIITEMNGQSPNDPKRFAEMVGSLKVGDTVWLTLFREKHVRQVMFKLPERPLLPGDLRPSPSDSLLRMRDTWDRPSQSQRPGVKPHSR